MSLWTKFRAVMKKISIVDKSLMIIMLILMIQSAFNLFVNEANSQDSSAIDAVVRTSAAAIFGYFLSANFVKKKIAGEAQSNNQTGAYLPIQTFTADEPKNQIGFEITSDAVLHPLETAQPQTDMTDAVPVQYSSHQVVIVSVIAVISLLTLLVFRNFTTQTAQAIATISQLRDFISASVGFLVGCGRYSTISD